VTAVFIDGAAGTTGLEIHARLAGRTDLELIDLDEARRRDPAARREALNDADIALLCLPDEAAREAATLAGPRTRLLDASSAHRTAEGWTYGFPELEPGRAGEIEDARRVSNPGCYPTGFLALVRPLVRAGLLPADALVSVNATSGYSGGGKAMIAEFAGGGPAFRPYALALGHKHVGEMTRHAGLAHPPVFQPAVAHVFRGMVVEVPLHAAQLTGPVAALADVLADVYGGSPAIRVRTDAPTTVAVEDDADTDRMTLHAFASADGRQARLVATLDNLGKGAAGAAVQNLNLMTGVDPLTGLRLPPDACGAAA